MVSVGAGGCAGGCDWSWWLCWWLCWWLRLELVMCSQFGATNWSLDLETKPGEIRFFPMYEMRQCMSELLTVKLVSFMDKYGPVHPDYKVWEEHVRFLRHAKTATYHYFDLMDLCPNGSPDMALLIGTFEDKVAKWHGNPHYPFTKELMGACVYLRRVRLQLVMKQIAQERALRKKRSSPLPSVTSW